MSIKKLFENIANNNNIEAGNRKDIYKEAESYENIEQSSIDQLRFVPHVDYDKPENFVTFGSARLYYKSAMNRITDYYPYDGSEAEITKYLNESLDIERLNELIAEIV